MAVISRGAIVHRTQLLARPAACRFAQCLAGNPRFCEVEVCESRHAKPENPERWYVQYQPRNPDRQLALIGAQLQQRLERAQAEGAGYQWFADPDQHGPRAFWHVLTLSGQVYEVDFEGRDCSCPDQHYRCRPAGLRCKHLLAYDAGQGLYHTPDQHDWPLIPGRSTP